MFALQNKIIVVDDTSEHLERLGKEFLNCGLGCRTILFDALHNDPLRNVRLAFFDINLYNTNLNLNQEEYDYTTDATLSTVFNGLVNALASYIAIDNGPYALIFWSSNTALIGNFITYVRERRHQVARPVIVSGINKDEFLAVNNEDDEPHLRNRIQEILSGTSINLLFEFEEKVHAAASESINNIYKLIPSNDRWGESTEFNLNFRNVFSKIAVNTVGLKQARANPDAAILEALAPTIYYNLISLDSDPLWKDHLTSLLTGSGSYPADFQVSKLNSIFHMDISNAFDFNRRGAVFEYWLIPSDTGWFKYFGDLNAFTKGFFDRFIQFKEGSLSKAERDKFRGDSKFIVVEISASCDYSQDKPRNSKFLFGLLTPNIDLIKIDASKIGESILYNDLPVLHYGERDWRLWFNFNFTFSGSEKFEQVRNPLFILKKEIIDMIGNRYANHVSRIGITTY